MINELDPQPVIPQKRLGPINKAISLKESFDHKQPSFLINSPMVEDTDRVLGDHFFPKQDSEDSLSSSQDSEIEQMYY